jgi:hypothetical protein
MQLGPHLPGQELCGTEQSPFWVLPLTISNYKLRIIMDSRIHRLAVFPMLWRLSLMNNRK